MNNNKVVLKTEKRFKSQRHVSKEEINKIDLSSNEVQRIQSIKAL